VYENIIRQREIVEKEKLNHAKQKNKQASQQTRKGMSKA
jgi:hypothetical protein